MRLWGTEAAFGQELLWPLDEEQYLYQIRAEKIYVEDGKRDHEHGELENELQKNLSLGLP